MKPTIKKTATARREANPRARRERMTAETALSFEATSDKSAEQVLNAIEERREAGLYSECSCEPYEDIFTFARWIALGFAPRKGEKSLRVASFVKVDGDSDSSDKEEGAEPKKGFLMPKTHFLFCRCQVTECAKKAA